MSFGTGKPLPCRAGDLQIPRGIGAALKDLDRIKEEIAERAYRHVENILEELKTRAEDVPGGTEGQEDSTDGD